jgi:CheY-like chemotaxis protein
MVKRKILIVEDEFILYWSLREIFERRGYEVCDIITTGKGAITIAEKEKPDVIIMDINLDGKMNGIEAGIKIKTRFGIPIIYLTGYSENELMEKSKEANPIGYLIKPIDVRALLSMIESIPQTY